jgi:hypothetical protein
MDRTPYEFRVEINDDDYSDHTKENRNIFKKIRGIAGLIDGFTVGDPDTVTISGPCIEGTATVNVDEDGFYGYAFFHKGKPGDYEVTYESDTITLTLKAGHFAEVNFP